MTGDNNGASAESSDNGNHDTMEPFVTPKE